MAIDVDTLRRILRVSSPEARMICWLILNGHNQAEIAEKLEITTRAVEGHMHRLRKRVEKMVARGAIQTRHQLQDSQVTAAHDTTARGARLRCLRHQQGVGAAGVQRQRRS